MGDEVIRSLGAVLLTESRVGDTVARIGGDEFALLLPDSRIEEALMLARRIRRAAEERFADEPHGMTISIGVAEAREASSRELLRDADEALYRAKSAGKNRVARCERAEEHEAAPTTNGRGDEANYDCLVDERSRAGDHL